MNWLTIAGLKTLAANKAARWIAAIVGGALLLMLARCEGKRDGRADATIGIQDSIAKVTAKQSAAFDKVRAGDAAHFADSLATLARAKAVADSAAAHATSVLNRITVLGPAKSPSGETPVSSAPDTGSGSAAQPPVPDTAKYVAIQRQGDPRSYTIPQFVVDAGAELRRALTASQAEARTAHAALNLATLTIADDSNAIRSRDATIAARTAAESAAKSKGECRILPLVPCLPHWLTFTIGGAAGGLAGYELGKQVAKK